LGDINPREIVVSSESFEISFADSFSQEAPEKEIVWRVEYVDTNGERICQQVSFQ